MVTKERTYKVFVCAAIECSTVFRRLSGQTYKRYCDTHTGVTYRGRLKSKSLAWRSCDGIACNEEFQVPIHDRARSKKRFHNKQCRITALAQSGGTAARYRALKRHQK